MPRITIAFNAFERHPYVQTTVLAPPKPSPFPQSLTPSLLQVLSAEQSNWQLKTHPPCVADLSQDWPLYQLR